jgi:hypothetical protein
MVRFLKEEARKGIDSRSPPFPVSRKARPAAGKIDSEAQAEVLGHPK